MPPEITQAVINAMVVIIGGMAAFLTGLLVNAGLRARAAAKQQEIDLKKQEQTNRAAADDKAMAIEREKLFLQQYNDTRAEITVLRQENTQREKENLELYKKVVTVEAQLDIVKVSRDERERLLQQEIEARRAIEAKFETARQEWEGERKRLEARIAELERRLSGVEQDIRATPVQELPAVSPDAELPKAG